MRQDGLLPDGAPPLGETIETDLAEYGFSVLRAALALREADRPSELTNIAFERAANAFEAIVRNGSAEEIERGYLRTIAATAYHLAGYSAVAYSLFNERADDLNLSPAETALCSWFYGTSGASSSRRVAEDEENRRRRRRHHLAGDEAQRTRRRRRQFSTTFCRSLAFFDFPYCNWQETAVGTCVSCFAMR